MENDKIEVLFNTNTLGLFGQDALEGAHLVRHKGEPEEEEFDIRIDGFFLAIGHKPNTEVFKGVIDLDEAGFIITEGKGTDPTYQQAVSAAGMGCRAAIDAERFILLHS